MIKKINVLSILSIKLQKKLASQLLLKMSS